ncbi:type VI secretion system baseplate subunit TssF [Myroides sp. DW712]|uniref:type VI secretion system baseplate subunit TssF n=1 Tax=Myroides sp. DW712 TaxID=3389800 RepID=UPI00397A121B
MKKIGSNSAKEEIKSRIMQQATKLWGVTNPHALDPFISLLIDAFSTEIFKVNNEIEQIKASILEKTARLLTPTMYTYSKPAHGIAVIEPEEAKQILRDHQEFTIKKVFPSSTKNAADLKLDIPFTAIDEVHLVKAKISHCLCGGSLWEYDAFFNKILVDKTTLAMPANQLFLAVDYSAYEEEYEPERLSLYCDNPRFESLDFVYKLLPFTTLSAQGSPLMATAGLSYPIQGHKTSDEVAFDGFSVEHNIRENIKSIYESKFIELSGFTGKISEIKGGHLPPALACLTQQKQVYEGLKGKRLLWIQIDFPPPYTPEIIQGFSFYLNAFPVYNRGWRCNESSLDIMGNTIPLVTQAGEAYLYMEQIVDTHAREYREIPFSESSGLAQGVYTIRKGGMERFSTRNAVDMISYVIELTRDEVSAFGILERDKVIETLQQMVQHMQLLDQRVKMVNGSIANEVYYAIVEAFADTLAFKASYWITHCDLANNIRKGTLLTQHNRLYADVNKPAILLSTTQGGEREKKGTDAIQAYKYALTTRDKIISVEDIKNYCKMMLQEHCKEVHISKGIQVSDKPTEGFIRTVNIEIVVDNFEIGSKRYWTEYAHNFKRQLVDRAIDGIEYKVCFKGEKISI